MKDKEFAAAKARVWKYTKKWDLPLGLRWWHQTHEWCDEPIGDAPEGRSVAGKADVDWQYCRVVFKWYLPGLAELDDTALEKLVVHEMMHVLTNEMRQWQDASDAMMHEERCATTLARAFQYIADNPFPKEKK